MEDYHRRRDFNKTGEPKGAVEAGSSGLVFVVQRHDASNLHFDLRLEREGVLKSWAVPKGIPLELGVRRLAVQTEDHPLDYADFEGTIPQGEYGVGEVKIWDKGFYELIKWVDKEIIFTPHGDKMKKTYVLIKMKSSVRFPGEDNWLLFMKKT